MEAGMVLVTMMSWAPPESNTTSESPYDVIQQLRAGSQKFADWFKFQFDKSIDLSDIM